METRKAYNIQGEAAPTLNIMGESPLSSAGYAVFNAY